MYYPCCTSREMEAVGTNLPVTHFLAVVPMTVTQSQSWNTSCDLRMNKANQTPTLTELVSLVKTKQWLGLRGAEAGAGNRKSLSCGGPKRLTLHNHLEADTHTAHKCQVG